MGQLQCEQVGVGWDVGGGSRELYMISSASSPACGEGAWCSVYCLVRGILPPANNVGQHCSCQSAPILAQSCLSAGMRDLERQACLEGGMALSVPR